MPARPDNPVPPEGTPQRELADTLRPQDPNTPVGIVTPPAMPKLPQSERYEIVELIGVGGMGKVYRAFDRKLKRPVALKFLRGGDAALERRFLQEAQAQARVDHQGVCKVYEVGRIGDEPYIAMQFIEGKTLREAARDLTVQQKLTIMRDVAEAVHAAHALGLVHRDIKPANILVEKCLRPFITDFGLARDLMAPGDTVQGALLGTPQYMAPEQAKGDHKSLDARTDVYGIGASLYDALTGRPPFDGGSHLQVLYKMTHEEPVPPRKHVPDLPADVESVVLKCLEKEPSRRYQNARALAEDLGRLIAGEPVVARPPGFFDRTWRKIRRNKALSAALAALLLAVAGPWVWRLIDRGAPITVAVADFDNQTGDEGLDGLSGMLITSLEQSRRLSVLTRSRMFDMLHQEGRDARRIDEPVGREVAQRSGAQALLLATIRKFDDLYTIDLKILDPRTNQYVAAIKEEATGKASVPPLIDKLSDAARRVLRDTTPAKPVPPVEEVTTRNLEAYQHFFKGEEAIDRLQFARAADQFRAALAIDKDFALAWYRLAYALMWQHDGPRAREAIERALALGDRMPEKERLLARGVRGSVFSKGQDAYDAYKECVDRWPGEKECAFTLGDVIFHAGYPKYAVPRFKDALRLDPMMGRAHQHLIWSYQLLGDKEGMMSAAQDYVAKVNDDEAWGELGRVQAALGRPEARATFRHAAQIFPSSALPRIDLAALDAWQFNVEGAIEDLKGTMDPQRPARERYLAHLTLGGALVQGGRVREAVRAFETAAADAREGGDPEEEAIALASDGFVHYLYLRDADGARRIAKDAVARGVTETMFAFLYPLLGDIDDYSRVLHTVGDPLADKSVETFEKRARGDYAGTADGIESLSDKSPYRDFLYYVLADSYLQAQKDSKAIDRLLRAQASFPGTGAPGPGFAGMFRARSDYQLGVLYERTGQPKLALEATRRFLDAWSKADADLPEVKDARARLMRLQSGAIEQPK
ncbi:MAG TPA: protein kinase [Myxococcales bacterium]|nr:protein kinase [Myxococcales bacterium]